jgi:hypothetical protein
MIMAGSGVHNVKLLCMLTVDDNPESQIFLMSICFKHLITISQLASVVVSTTAERKLGRKILDILGRDVT